MAAARVPAAEAEPSVRHRAATSLYGIFESEVTNGKSYANPFDFRTVELRTDFTSPSGRTLSFFGFYDGDGKGGQTGDVWKFRCMPDEVGTWKYRYFWTDGSPGGEGTFDVEDTGLPGPLKVASDNPWYFMTSRGEAFHARPYGMHQYLTWSQTHRLPTELEGFLLALQEKVIDRGYNLIMWPSMGDRIQKGTVAADGGLPVGRSQLPLDAAGGSRTAAAGERGPVQRRPLRSEYASIPQWRTSDSWWIDATDTNRFSIRTFRANEDGLEFCRDKGIYVLTFAGFVEQCNEYEFEEFQVFLRYFLARMAPYSNFFGWSPTWEWMDIWTPEEVTQVMRYVHDHDPWKRLLTVHDNSHSTFTGWLGFSMRQAPYRDVFGANSRRAGHQQIRDAHGSGGIGDPFIDLPIIGSEDIWESPEADRWSGWAVPRNGIETMRAAWGIQMAGVIPLYDEWNAWTRRPPGNGLGEPHVRRMFDFCYSHTDYRRYVQLNELVSRDDGQIASGHPGKEYVIYDWDGGSISLHNLLSESSAEHVFSVTWFDPATGAHVAGGSVAGGSDASLRSPFSSDTVLFLKRTSGR
jgi:hypothetical protein